MPRPYTLKFFLPDGEPDGVRCVTKSGWIGSGLVVPRPLLGATKTRDEFDRPGVYLLTGPGDDGGLPAVYIGEGSPVRSRLESHLNTKDFWTACVFFTANDGSLNKAHIQHLESRLVDLARKTKRCVLDNTQQPGAPVLTESERADSDNFLDEMLSILPLVGVDVFEQPEAADAARVSRSPELLLDSKGVEARGRESNAGFVVHAGSQAVSNAKLAPSCEKHVLALRDTLLQNGVLSAQGSALVFEQDYEFNSPSLSASVVRGASSNGRVEWKNARGETLKQIQDAADPADPASPASPA